MLLMVISIGIGVMLQELGYIQLLFTFFCGDSIQIMWYLDSSILKVMIIKCQCMADH